MEEEHIYTSVIIRDLDDRFLIMHHTKKTETPWRFPGGKPHHGELLIVSAARELHEELGIEACSLVLNSIHVGKIDGGRWRGYYYICDAYHGTPVIMETEKHDEIKWASLSDLRFEGTHPAIEAAEAVVGNGFKHMAIREQYSLPH